MLFFFNQKTAYEMRISDWSSDVCSSDLSAPLVAADACLCPPAIAIAGGHSGGRGHGKQCGWPPSRGPLQAENEDMSLSDVAIRNAKPRAKPYKMGDSLGLFLLVQPSGGRLRSEEHTSELQSLMRISYAVFCLKKKT